MLDRKALSQLLRNRQRIFLIENDQLYEATLTTGDLLNYLAGEEDFIDEITPYVGLLTAEDLMARFILEWNSLSPQVQKKCRQNGVEEKYKADIERFECEVQWSEADRLIQEVRLKEISQLAADMLVMARTGAIPEDYEEIQKLIEDFTSTLEQWTKYFSMGASLNAVRPSINSAAHSSIKETTRDQNAVAHNLCALNALWEVCEFVRLAALEKPRQPGRE